MWDTIRRLIQSGSTVLLTTQYLEEADQLAARIAVIDHGHVVAEGTVDELKSSVGTSSLQLRVENLRDIGLARQTVERVLRVPTSISAEAAKITAPLASADRVTDLLIALREAGISLAELSVQKPTLDEVFLSITGHGVEEKSAPASAKSLQVEGQTV
ncbi:Daunorubicin/doxorubicin resistance ATP-binding protein DrrA [compost metagenome]